MNTLFRTGWKTSPLFVRKGNNNFYAELELGVPREEGRPDQSGQPRTNYPSYSTHRHNILRDRRDLLQYRLF